ncbi:hypothetical protein [Lactiplantibacillus carotarum]|uniref:hypothetical protein n=1 Tax=Lactiplantibacillus carotarum TaxID=2993456 RepID=UPI00298F0209|nr:hypothetical protein [Lactiplantibacillus carotarum]
MSLEEQIESTKNSLNRAQRLASFAASAADLVYKGTLARTVVVSFDKLDDDGKAKLFGEYDCLLIEIEAYLSGLQDQFQDVDQGLSNAQTFLTSVQNNQKSNLEIGVANHD